MPEASMVKIMVDTTCGLTLEDYQKLGITAIPLYVCQGEVTKKECFELSYADFYKAQRGGQKFITSQPDPNSFLEVFRPVIEAGDEIICVTLSNKISGTINCANLAKQILGTEKISVFDSFQSGFCQASLAVKAKELADEGRSRTEIIRQLEDQRNRTKTFFIVESLRYLYEGGRLNGAEALIGSLIQIKPIIWFDETGLMTSLEKIRTLKAAKQRTLELLQEQAKLGIEKIALHYGDNFDEAKEYAALIEQALGVKVSLTRLSPVIATHTGPDILGPCIITKK
jgi:EDD domain protein, DegV family